jgi:hypothetical protein
MLTKKTVLKIFANNTTMPPPIQRALFRRRRRLRLRRARERLEEMENKGETYLTPRERLENMEEPQPQNQEFGKKRESSILRYLKSLLY